MNSPRVLAATRPGDSLASALATNRVIRNTYRLLALTLAFSALVAGVSAALKLSHPGLIITLVGYFGLLYLTTRFRDQALGLAFVFALTGFMGYTLGPIVSAYLSLPNGHQIVMTAMGATAATFLGFSGYALVSRRDFSFLGSFLFAGVLVAFLGGLAAIFLELPGAVARGVGGIRVVDGRTDPIRDEPLGRRR